VTLLTGLATTGSNVFKTRVYSHGDDKLPSLNIVNGPERVIYGIEGEPIGDALRREVVIIVQHRAKEIENVDDVTDQSCAEVEAAIYADPELANLAEDVALISTTPVYSGDQEKPSAMVEQQWAVRYSTPATDPETILWGS